MKKILISFLVLLFFAAPLFAQTTISQPSKAYVDSVKAAYYLDLAIRYPALRPAALSMDVIGKGNVDSCLYGQDLYKGRSSIIREKINFNIPVVKFGKNSLIASFNYLNQHFMVDHIRDASPQAHFDDMDFNKQTIGFALTYSRFDSLFNRPVIYSAAVSGYTDNLSSVKRVNYSGSVLFLLKHGAHTSYNIGLMAIVDPSTPLPILPLVNIWHQFGGNGPELYIDLPTRIALRKQLSTRSWLSVNTELGGSFAFINLNQPLIPQENTFSTLELKTGPTFEYMVFHKLIIGLNGGLFTTLDSRIFKRNTNPNDYFLNNKSGSVPYVNLSVSLLPFGKTKQ